MTMRGMGWAWSLTGVAPDQKLLALRLGDSAQASGSATVKLADLEAFVGVERIGILDALDSLQRSVGIAVLSLTDASVTVQMPAEACDTDPPVTVSAPPRQMSVYVVTAAGRTKIGISLNLSDRLRQFRTSIPSPVTLEWSVELDEAVARKVERAAFVTLADRRLTGEWFSVTAEEAIRAVRSAIPEVPPA